MAVIRIVMNAFIMAAEIAAIVGLAYLGYQAPFVFAAVTVAVCLIYGLRLEYARLSYELPFYFEAGRSPRVWFALLVGSGEAIVKSLLAGVAALFTFSGTDSDRLFLVAIVFGISVYLGSWMLRSLSIGLGARPSRWGYFRLAAPLGVIFSAGMTGLAMGGMIPMPSISELGLRVVWEFPAQPSIEQVSELVFQLKQAFDNFVVRTLSVFMPADAARVIGVLISVNMLTGFVSALYASVIAGAVRVGEERLP